MDSIVLFAFTIGVNNSWSARSGALRWLCELHVPSGAAAFVSQGEFVTTECAKRSALRSSVELSQLYLSVPFPYNSLGWAKHEIWFLVSLSPDSITSCIKRHLHQVVTGPSLWGEIVMGGSRQSTAVHWVGQFGDGLCAFLPSGLWASPFCPSEGGSYTREN